MSENEIFVSVGRRKTAVARARLSKGSGKITVNNKSLADYCYTDQLQMIAMRPLVCTGLQDSVDANIGVKGGGPVGSYRTSRGYQPCVGKSVGKDGSFFEGVSEERGPDNQRPAL